MKLSLQISSIMKSVVVRNSNLAALRRGGHQRVQMAVQALEPRTLLTTTGFNAAAAETMLVYLVNQTRVNPEATASRLAVSLPANQIGPFAPLVVNPALQLAARRHSDDMLVNNYLSHTGLNGSSAGSRATAAGYPSVFVGENVYMSSSGGPISDTPEKVARDMNDGWFKSSGHRSNMLAANWTEFGVGIAVRLSPTGATRGTEVFGSHSPGPFLTGVVFNDLNTSSFYNMDEGLAGVTVTIAGPAGTFTATTTATGAWTAAVPPGEYIVTASGASFSGTSSVSLAVGNSNVAVDFISGISTGWINFTQYVNSAPVLSTTPAPSLPPIVLGTPSPPGVSVSSLLIDAFSDANPLSPQGIAITSAPTTAAGVWQYSTNGGTTWVNLGQPSGAVARMLRAQDLIRLLPSGSQATTATISYRAWDQSTGTAGANADTTVSGGSTAFSTAVETATVTTIESNTAPVLASTGGNNLSSVAEDTLSPAGTTVAAILGSSLTDVDSGTPPGLAVIGITGSSNGVWSYSINSGTSWEALASVSGATAIPLRASDLLRFVPAKDFVGSASVTFRGWDQSTGLAGVAVNLASAEAVGGSTAYSVASSTASIAVTPVNDAPTLLPGRSSLRFKPVAANTSFSFTGTTVADLLGNSVLDVDTSAKIGIAVVGVGANMTFWWNTGGSSWTGGGISASNALLLRETDTLGFAPDSGFTGTTTISFRLWDQTAGNPGWNGANLSNPAATTGGTTAFGSEILTATLSIGPAGTAPTATFGAVTRADDGAAVASIPITFSRAVEGLDAADFVLTRNGATVPLQNATLTGSGTAFVLGNLADMTSATGSYTLTIPATRTGVTDTVGNRMTGLSSTTFSVTAVNRAPVAQASSVTTDEDTAKTFASTDFLFTDAEGDPLNSITVSSLNLASGDTLQLNGTNVSVNNVISAAQIPNLVYTPAANANGSARSTWTFRVNDAGSGTVAATMTINVRAVNDAPVITSNGGGANAAISVAENQTAVTTVISTDVDTPAQQLTYTKTGGADAAKFSMTSDGVLTFISAPDFENPGDADLNNTYLVQITVNDGNGGTTLQNLTVTVTGVNDHNPVFTSSATLDVVENSTAVIAVAASDDDLPASTVSFSISGGADQSRFSITSGGVLTFDTAPDFENPNDANTDNVYLVQVMANDGNGGTTTQDLSIRVVDQLDGTNGNEAFVVTYSASAVAITVGTTSLGTFSLDTPLTLNGLGGTDSVKIVLTSDSDVIEVSSSGLLINGSSLILTSIETRTLVGGAGNDIYRFDADASLGLWMLEESGVGTDTIDFSPASAAVSVSLGTTATQVINDNLSLKLNSATAFENATGGSGNDTLVGNARANVLRGNGGNDRFYPGLGSDTLIGGPGNDTYHFSPATAGLEADTVSELVGGGTDTLNFAGITTSVVVNLGLSTTQALHTNRTLKLNSGNTLENANGGSGNDTLVGNALANVLNGNAGHDRFYPGRGNDTLIGGSGDDTYYFIPATSGLEADTVIELVGGGTDTLNFAGITTSVIANLALSTVQNVHANRTLKLNLNNSVESAIGGSGNDTLTGNTLDNVLVGNAGSDTLIGGDGRDILIGGLGLDTLNGGAGDDILIAGRTTSDNNVSSLNAFRRQWTSGNTYTVRVSNLRAGVGSPVVSLKAKTNVLNDAGEDDSLTGGTGTDWYFRALDDAITDLFAGELIDVL